jgi:hypothetical protein
MHQLAASPCTVVLLPSEHPGPSKHTQVLNAQSCESTAGKERKLNQTHPHAQAEVSAGNSQSKNTT